MLINIGQIRKRQQLMMCNNNCSMLSTYLLINMIKPGLKTQHQWQKRHEKLLTERLVYYFCNCLLNTPYYPLLLIKRIHLHESTCLQLQGSCYDIIYGTANQKTVGSLLDFYAVFMCDRPMLPIRYKEPMVYLYSRWYQRL